LRVELVALPELLVRQVILAIMALPETQEPLETTALLELLVDSELVATAEILPTVAAPPETQEILELQMEMELEAAREAMVVLVV
jgi:hypothetical protein